MGKIRLRLDNRKCLDVSDNTHPGCESSSARPAAGHEAHEQGEGEQLSLCPVQP